MVTKEELKQGYEFLSKYINNDGEDWHLLKLQKWFLDKIKKQEQKMRFKNLCQNCGRSFMAQCKETDICHNCFKKMKHKLIKIK